ncbi:MAG TPA: glycosyltransferase [bacterium]|nr:glycosyltransferase [bacterium]
MLLKTGGVNLIGYFDTSSGVAQAARDFAYKLRDSGLPFSIYPLRAKGVQRLPSLLDQGMARRISPRLPYRANLWLFGAREIAPSQRKTPALFANRYNIVAPFWEYASGIEGDLAAWEKVDEVAAFTGFIQSAIEQMAPGRFRISRVPYPHRRDWEITASRQETREKLGLGTGDFVFMFSFDYYSSFRRKNPLGVVSAFAAGLAGKADARLVIKVSNPDSFPRQRELLRDHIRQAGVEGQVKLIEEILPRDELMTLMSSIDCYVSLHRGEGLGLGMFEAMALGKPVIASRYGGALDFLNDANSLLVQCALAKAREDHPAYLAVKQWAEPGLEQAREFMVRLYHDRGLAAELGARAQRTAHRLLASDEFNSSARELIARTGGGATACAGDDRRAQ